MIPVTALVRVTTNNELDFNEWLDYHIALGFDRIYVYDTANRGWLPEACRKRQEHVTLVPPWHNDWRKKRNIISNYVASFVEPTWTVLLEDDEFIWMDLNVAPSLSAYVNKFLGKAAEAMSIYVKYLSSETPMKNRVGTLIDCFQHSRPNPQGLVHPCSHTPNFAVTFFYVKDNHTEPMRGPLQPSSPYWRDAVGARLNDQVFGAYLTSNAYDPDRYPIRCYKYGLKSGIEMNMAPGTKPVGYTVKDLAMLNERAALLKIPANDMTETLFAKDDVLAEKPDLPKRVLSDEERAELELPIPLGKIDTYILYGYTLDHVVELAAKAGYADTVEHRATIERVYRRECSMIVESSPVYKKLSEIDAEGGRTDEMICSELKISKPALEKMRKCLAVLDIKTVTEIKDAVVEAEAKADDEAAKSIVEESDMAKLTEQFDASVALHPATPEDTAVIDKKIEDRKAKRREQAKKYRSKKKENEKAKEEAVNAPEPGTVNVGTANIELAGAVLNDASAALINPTESVDDLAEDLDSTNLLDSVDLSAFENK